MHLLTRKPGSRPCEAAVWAVALWLAIPIGPAAAQAPQAGSGSSNATNPPASSAAATDLPGDFIYLPDESGKLVPVPVDANLRDYLQSRNENKQSPETKEPAFAFTSVEVAGTAQAAVANLAVTLGIKVNRDEAVRIPLGFKEGTLRDHSHDGPGDAFPDEFNRETTGYTWWFQGRGLHKLVLAMSVPVQAQLPSQRLQLTLPQAAIRSLKLTVPVPLARLTVKAPENTALATKAAGDNAAEIELFGIGGRLDLAWQATPVEADAKPVLQAKTAIHAELVGETVLLNAEQHIHALHGNFSELSIRLPPKFQLVSIEGSEYKTHELTGDGHVRVMLTGPTTGPVKLQWWLESEPRQPGEALIVEGFDVAGAHQQDGEISISAFDGYRVARRDADSRFVYRIPPVNSQDESPATRAYRFRAQPFRLALDLQQVEPEYTADAQYFLLLSADRTDLDAIFNYQVFSGAVQEVEVDWPALKSQGWTVESPKGQDLVERVDFDESRSKLRVVLSQRKTGDFTVALKARRKVNGEQQPFDLQLPRAAVRGSALLVVANGDNVKADVVPAGGTIARPIPPDQTVALNPPPGFDSLSQQKFALDSDTYDFSASVTAHARLIKTETVASVKLDGNKLLVSQQVLYDVSYERLSQVRLVVPRPLRARVDFRTNDGVPLNPDWSGFDVGNSKQVHLLLPEARLGTFGLTAQFVVELAAESLAQKTIAAAVPLIRSADAEYSTVQFEYQRNELFDVALHDGSWEPRFPSASASIWSTAEPKAEIAIDLLRTHAGPAQSYTVRKVLVRTAIDHDGFARSRAQYRIAGDAADLTLFIPDGIEVEGLWWGSRPMAPGDEVRELNASPRTMQLTPRDAAADKEQLLTVNFRSKAASPLGWSDMQRFDSPHFPADVWVEQTAWDVVLPYDQHLFTRPRGFTPQWQWQRDLVFWSRMPRGPFADLDQWIVAVDGPPARDDLSLGNSYVFSRFGPVTEIAFSSMSRSLVVLFGAGLALAVGFLLLRIPAARNVLTLLVAVFLVALIQMWQRVPVQLLLQPAIFGFLLAVGAALIEKSFKRDVGTAVLTLSTPSDFVIPSTSTSSVRSPAAADTGSPNAFRQPGAPEPVSTSDSGSRP